MAAVLDVFRRETLERLEVADGGLEPRIALLQRNDILVGPIVPEWFRVYSDGCSLPLPGKLKSYINRKAERVTRRACLIHDFEYYQARLLWSRYAALRNAGGNAFEVARLRILWKNKRRVADANFRANIALLWRFKRAGARSVFGLAMAQAYWWGVRLGGRDGARVSPRDLAMVSDR